MLISRSRIALTLVAVALVACSSAPPPDGTPLQGEVNPSGTKKKKTTETNSDSEGTTAGTTTNQDSNDPADQDDPTTPGTPVTPGTPTAPTGQCAASQSFDQCAACCDQAFPGGFEVDAQAFGQCVCESPGTCAAVCGTSFCAGAQATPACEQCLATATQCQTQTETVCNANAACKGAFACYDSSGCEAKP